MTVSKTLAVALAMASIAFTGCKKEGCTDSSATNFDSDAKTDDGSCEYADYRDGWQGTYSLTYYYHYYTLDSAMTTTRDTIEYSGEVQLSRETYIWVDFPPGMDSVEYFVSPDGVLNRCGEDLGTLSDSGIEIEYDDDLCSPGPLGSNYTVRIVGSK